MSDRILRSPRGIAALVAAALLLFALSLYLMSKGGDAEPPADESGPSSFSRSALGYAGFADMLRELHASVVQSRFDSLSKLGPGGMLIVAEPRASFGLPAPALKTLLGARAVLLILPKWQGEPSRATPGWIAGASLKPSFEATSLLAEVLGGGEVVRRDAVEGWDKNQLAVTPKIEGTVQLVRSSRLKPIVADGDDILIGELNEKGRRLWVLSDPDVLDNHGFGRGDNALFGLALVNRLHGKQGVIVFDETVHGFTTEAPSEPLPLLFKFPFSLVTAQIALAVILLLWATLPRFGAAQPLAAPLDAGKRGLIANSARLIAFAGHRRIIARRYAQAVIQDSALRLRLPPGLAESEQVDRLRRIGLARGAPIDLSVVFYQIKELTDRPKPDPVRLASLVRDLHHWKQSIADESSGRARHR
jgi:hypothetical protein